MKYLRKLWILGVIGITVFFTNLIYVNAASAYISVSSSRSTVVVGNTFTVTTTLSSSEILGSWNYTLDYSSSVIKFVSGEINSVGWGDGSRKSISYSYTFKAISSGTASVGIKGYQAYAWDESEFSLGVGSTSIRVITQAELEASYSKDNNLRSLSVAGTDIAPVFDSNTLEYSCEVSSNTEKVMIEALTNDSSANVSGIGEVAVSEGDNKFEIIVTAENGSKKTYILTIKVADPNPINVKTTDGKSLTVVKRASSLVMPTTFAEKIIKIKDIEVPAFYSEITKITLVGLKDTKGNVNLYSYDTERDTYSLYREIKFNSLTIYPLELLKNNKFEGYTIKTVEINKEKVEVYKYKSSSKFSIFYGINIENNKKDYYIYDSVNKSVIAYSDEEIINLKEKIINFQKIIIVLSGTILILLMFIVFLLATKKKKIKKILNELKNKTIEKEEIKEEKVEEKIVKEEEEKKSKKKNRKEKIDKKLEEL